MAPHPRVREEQNYHTLANRIYEEAVEKVKSEKTSEPINKYVKPPFKKASKGPRKDLVSSTGPNIDLKEGEVPKSSNGTKMVESSQSVSRDPMEAPSWSKRKGLSRVHSASNEKSSSTQPALRNAIVIRENQPLDQSTPRFAVVPSSHARPGPTNSSHQSDARKKRILSNSEYTHKNTFHTTHEIASSSCGKVKVSLTCNYTQHLHNLHIPTGDRVISFSESICRNFNQTNQFSLVKMLNVLCESYLEAGGDSTKEKHLKTDEGKMVISSCSGSSSKKRPHKVIDKAKGTENVEISRLNESGGDSIKEKHPKIDKGKMVISSCSGSSSNKRAHKVIDIAKGTENVEISHLNENGGDSNKEKHPKTDKGKMVISSRSGTSPKKRAHKVIDIAKGTENVEISCLNETRGDSTKEKHLKTDKGKLVISSCSGASSKKRAHKAINLAKGTKNMEISLVDETGGDSTREKHPKTGKGKKVISSCSGSSSKKRAHKVIDIAKGTENVEISLTDEMDNEELPQFVYFPQSIVYESAYVHISLARMADEDCCSDCVGDCLSSSIPCACARDTGGEFAYTPEGLLDEKFLDSCVLMKFSPQNHNLFYCQNCPLERAKKVGRQDKCKGHLLRKFVKECWRKCGCSMQCGNRVVQRGITRKLQVFCTDEGKGWGLRTLEELPKGAFVCEYVGEILTNIELYERNKKSKGQGKHVYPVLLDADWATEGVLDDKDALCLDATYYGNIARFINHRCSDANLLEIPVQVETPDRHYYHLAFFTKRKVEALEELTWDYGIEFDDKNHPIKAFQCCCGSQSCRDKKRKH